MEETDTFISSGIHLQFSLRKCFSHLGLQNGSGFCTQIAKFCVPLSAASTKKKTKCNFMCAALDIMNLTPGPANIPGYLSPQVSIVKIRISPLVNCSHEAHS